jgi:hypothetical protein
MSRTSCGAVASAIRVKRCGEITSTKRPPKAQPIMTALPVRLTGKPGCGWSDMAHPSVLAKTGAIELDTAANTLQELLPEEQYPEVHDNLRRAQHDAVGRSDGFFKVKVLAGAFARPLAAQEVRIRELEEAARSS